MTIPDPLIAILRQARHVAILTGAGVSAESGIPTFRDALTGLWERFDAEDLATRDAFRRDAELVWGWYEWRRAKVLRSAPNPAHQAIAEMARHVPKLSLITQNVDDLHERAGSTDVIHLHGSLHHPRCLACARPYTFPPGIPDEPEGGRRIPPPKCGHCGGPIRPGVVWFGEDLPEAAWKKATSAAAECDVFFSIGTSAMAYPAANLPIQASERRAVVVQVNPHSTSLDKLARFNLVGGAGGVMADVVGTLKEAAD
jgi:NAD-dependent deacetylase